MTVYDQAYELQENLTAFLTQQYAPGYEVVVVDESSTDETPDILKLLKKDYPNLYTTFLPKSEGHAMSKKQAYNIGIKAAKNDWLIFANASHAPVNADILQAINDTFDDTADLTLGYLTKTHRAPTEEGENPQAPPLPLGALRFHRYQEIGGLRCAEVLRTQAIVCSASGFALAHFLEKPVLQI